MTLAPAATDRPDWLTTEVCPYPTSRLPTPVGTISYTDIGSGPVLLFVHVGMWSIIWRDLIAPLHTEFRCITLDAPGTGLSDAGTAAPSIANAAVAVDALVEELNLDDFTLVVHDLGGPAGLHAAAKWPQRVNGLVVVNAFGWQPSGSMFRAMLAVMGNSVVRESDAWTGWLPRASSSRLGVGRHWDRPTRRVYRRGFRRPQRRTFHRYMRSARRHDFRAVEATVATLADRPVLTIFGQRNDPLRFQPQWKERVPNAQQLTVRNGYHFPMCDAPDFVADAIRTWHHQTLVD